MGKATDFPTCKLCGEAHRIIAGKVCPKFHKAAKPKAKAK